MTIRSREELEHWLSGKPRALAVAIAARAALRALPALESSAALRNVASTTIEWTLTVFRATLVSSAAATGLANDFYLYCFLFGYCVDVCVDV
ncbi:MAG: hypothetical protein K2V38_19085, partial [Gemmataceae bacterium]|nr:hypothetical protein [Gemmataceae bacterium]